MCDVLRLGYASYEPIMPIPTSDPWAAITEGIIICILAVLYWLGFNAWGFALFAGLVGAFLVIVGIIRLRRTL